MAIWGCGPVGQFAIKSAWMLGAARVIAIDQVPERLELARREGQAETLNFDDEDIFDALTEMTGGRGPDRPHGVDDPGRPLGRDPRGGAARG